MNERGDGGGEGKGGGRGRVAREITLFFGCSLLGCHLIGASPVHAADARHVNSSPVVLNEETGKARMNHEKRIVLALVDLREEERVRLTRIHSAAEMPLNHLGLTVVYWDIGSKGLPDLNQWPDLRGVITWFAGAPFTDPRAYIQWAVAALDRGLRFVVMGQPGIRQSRDRVLTPMTLVNRFYGRFGVRDDDGYTDLTHLSVPVVADHLIGFERDLGGVIPGYPRLRRIDDRVTPHLVMRRGGDAETDSALVVTGPMGGFVTEGFDRHYDLEFNRKTWIIDPFEFFREAFDTDELPKPDVTTLSGRRVYFSHIDGDGWRNQTEIPAYAKKITISATVVRRELIEAFPDLPVSVAPIVGDLDPAMAGTVESREEARLVFALPQVEVASHTWSHPFFWGWFEDYTPEKETEFQRAAAGKGKPGTQFLAEMFGRKANVQVDGGGEGAEEANGLGRYKVPRAFLQEPFDLREEVVDSLAYMEALAPADKPRPRLLQWSGDTQPWEQAIREAREAGYLNMNGGDSRFDSEYPSYSSVAPIGKPVGAERQIYAATSNENTYTELWTARFYGFQNLVHTLDNTETPIRVKPFNIYYHTYSGQKLASLNAVRKNLMVARASQLAPVMASRYVEAANGFYVTRFTKLGDRRWRIGDRGNLQTIRFDRASFDAVDFARSHGVIGQRHLHGGLYVALDPAVPEPVLALMEVERADVPPDAPRPYLIQGRWELSGLAIDGQGWRFTAWGYGAGEMEWFAPWPGRYRVTVTRGDAVLWRGDALASSTDHRLRFEAPVDAIKPVVITIEPSMAGGG